LNEFRNAINDDLNTPKALAALNKAVKMPLSADIYRLVTEKFDSVLSLSLEHAVIEQTATEKKTAVNKAVIPNEIIALAEKRLTAKREKDFATADKLRTEIAEHGYQITDTANGYEIKHNDK
jgi:cysteinyl-tRNA synthetase